MKLQNKIGILNIALSLVFLLIAGVVLYVVTNNLVYREMDEHMEGHRRDIVAQLHEEHIGIDHLEDFRPSGSVEWLEIEPVDSDTLSANYQQFSTIRFSTPSQADSSTFRRYRSVIQIDDHPFMLTLFEEITGWQEISFTIMITMFGMLVFWVALMYAGNHLAFRRLLSPFYATVRKLPTLRGPRSFTTRFHTTGTDEIDQLHKALNHMLRQLKTLFEEQKEFLQNASHELLTPLAIIRQKTDKLLKNNRLDEPSFRALTQIQETVMRMSRLSNTLLLISKIESNQFELDQEIVIPSLLDNLRRELHDFIEAKSLDFKTSVPDHMQITGNRELVYALLFNLVQNAIKFTPDGKAIEVTGRPLKEGWELKIRDQGVGIPKEKLKHIFKRFKKTYESWDESPGLGLSIVKSICELHDFDYHINSLPGEGTTFTLVFPASAV